MTRNYKQAERRKRREGERRVEIQVRVIVAGTEE